MNGKLSLMTLIKTNMIPRTIHSPLTIECVLKAHYQPEFIINTDYEAQVDAINKLIQNGILDRHNKYDLSANKPYDYTHYTLTEKGKAFVEMILNTPYPIQSWTDPRN